MANLIPTLINGLFRAFKINVSEETPDGNINDAGAKAIKILTRLIVLIILYYLFPDQFRQFFTLVFQG